MSHIGRRVEPWRLTDGRCKARLFQRNKNRRGRVGHSTHLVGLAVDRDPFGTHLILFNRGRIAVGRGVLAHSDDLSVAPRVLIREVGASVTVQTLSLARTVIVACGFSKLGGQDRTTDRQRFVRVVTAPAMMRDRGGRQQHQRENVDDSSRHGTHFATQRRFRRQFQHTETSPYLSLACFGWFLEGAA